LTVVLLLALGAGFNGGAKTLPRRVGRLWLAPAAAVAPGGYGKDGDYKAYASGEGSLKMLNPGFALE
jgi:hypothetical protein